MLCEFFDGMFFFVLIMFIFVMFFVMLVDLFIEFVILDIEFWLEIIEGIVVLMIIGLIIFIVVLFIVIYCVCMYRGWKYKYDIVMIVLKLVLKKNCVLKRFGDRF